MSYKRVAILGATGHIAKNLILSFSEDKESQLFLFARDKKKVAEFTKKISFHLDPSIEHLGAFNDFSYDVIINAIGVGNPQTLLEVPEKIFEVTEIFDNLILDYLKKNENTLYINFSSGAVYGNQFSSPITNQHITTIEVNNTSNTDCYRISKIHSEFKHRALNKLSIIDLRIFSFFSHLIDLNFKYFMTDLLRSVLEENVLRTANSDMVRDFIHPEDLYQLVKLCMKNKGLNGAYDVISKEPVKKSEIIDHFIRNYSLKVERLDSEFSRSATGGKDIYCSQVDGVSYLGFKPRFTSLEAIASETLRFFKNIRSAKGDPISCTSAS